MELIPLKGEKKNDFINRALTNDKMKEDYPDIKARFARAAYEWFKAKEKPSQ